MLVIKPHLDDDELKIYNSVLSEIGVLIEGQNEYVNLGKTAFDIHGRGYFFGYGIMRTLENIQEKVEQSLLQLPFIFVTEKNYKLMNKAHPTIIKHKQLKDFIDTYNPEKQILLVILFEIGKNQKKVIFNKMM